MSGQSARARVRTAVVAIVGTLLTLALLSGCGPVTPQRAAAARAATSAPTGPMTFQLPGRPAGFDPFAPLGAPDHLLAAAHFEPLVSSVDGRILPRMADWWGSIHDDRTVLLTIKHAFWSDGTRMGAADLLFTLEEHLRPGSRSAALPALLRIQGARDFHEGRASHVSGIVAETSRGVVISLLDSDPNFIAQLTGVLVLPRHVYAGQDLGRPELFRAPRVGSGAYLFDAWEGDDRVVLKPNPQFRPFTRLDKVVGRVVSPDQVVPALERGELDLALEISSSQLDRLPAGYRELTAPGDRVVGLSGRGPLADIRFRQAVIQSIDRQRILDEHLGGHGRVVDSVMFSPDWATSPERVRWQSDPAAAQDLLAATGWSDDRTLTLVALTDDLATGPWEAIVADLARVGIRATITVRPVGERAAVWADPAVDGVIESYRMAVPDPVQVGQWVACGVPSGYCNPDLDGLFDRGRSQLVATERRDTYAEADDVLATELPVIPLWVPDAAIAVVEERGGVSPLLQPATAMIDLWGPA
ncbi:ABC transporter substrate-binding protein [Granulicoccus sp. GXG6511]|uniref:ABC transporter substrate-binding protein n=1 Tax=Granulicoccus sp. GXG6511 TaxID=3381351 RepID=UPI003D7CC63B